MNLLPFYQYLYKDKLSLPEGKLYFFEFAWEEIFTHNILHKWEETMCENNHGGYVLAKDEAIAKLNVRDEMHTLMGIPNDIEIYDDEIKLHEVKSPEDRYISKTYWNEDYPMGTEGMTCGQYFKTWKKIEDRNKRLIELDKTQLKFSFMEDHNG